MAVDDDKSMPHQTTADVFDEAAEWFMRLEQNNQDARVLADFASWLEKSSEHRNAWDKTCRAWNALGSVARLPSMPAHPVQARSVMPRRFRSGFGRRGVSRVSKGIALFAALCLGIALLPEASFRLRADHVTANLETRTITLADGTAVTLAPESAIAVDYQPSKRSVTLLAGEAYFDVRRDEDQPFIVHARDMKIEVLGTAFDVNLSSHTTSVTLEHGAIRATVQDGDHVSPQLLVPGERMVLHDASGTIERQTIDPAEIAAWRNGQLFVVNETIGDVIDRIRPYHPAWISIPDPVLANSRVTGFYDLTRPDEALEALVAPYGGHVRTVTNHTRIVSRL